MFGDIKDFLISFFKKMRSKTFIKRFVWLIVICVLTIFIPLSIAICYSASIQQEQKNTSPIISISLHDENGELIASDSTQENIIASSHFINIFYKMLNTKTEVVKPLEFDAKPSMSFTFKKGSEETTYKCYFKETLSSNYVEDENGNFYLIDSKDYSTFLKSEYSEKIYAGSLPPTLYTMLGEPILPKHAEWTYKLNNKNERLSENYISTQELLTYRITGAIDFDFSNSPDDCNITVKNLSDDVIFSGSLEELTSLTAEENSELLVTINANWEKQETIDSYGSLKYEFKILCAEPSTFHINKSEASGGEIILLNVSGIDNVDSIIYTPSYVSPQETDNASAFDSKALNELYSYKPIFTKKGSEAYALLPIPINIPDTKFTFSLSCGISKSEFTVSLKQTDSEKIEIDLHDPFASTALMNAKKAEFSRIIFYLKHSNDDLLLLSKDCLLPTDYGFTLKYRYNTNINQSFDLLANTYTADMPDGISVQSASVGKVSLAGRSELLGNYVIVDHGMGVCIWYCGLSDVSVSEGDILKKGDPVGRAGSSSLLCENGVNILCSVGGILIDPNELINYN